MEPPYVTISDVIAYYENNNLHHVVQYQIRRFRNGANYVSFFSVVCVKIKIAFYRKTAFTKLAPRFDGTEAFGVGVASPAGLRLVEHLLKTL